MRKLTFVLVAMLSLCAVQRAGAWGSAGHYCAAYIAEQHLTPEAKAKCRYYLKHTLPYYAMWMDQWRGVEQYKAINSGHAINVKRDGKNLDWEGFTPPGRAMGHLVKAYGELGNGKYKELSDSVVRQRLINMIHYIPDMHCPGHIDFRDYKYPLQGDYKIYRKGKRANFHGFWDGSLMFARKRFTVAQYADMVDNISPKQAKRWQKGLEKGNLQAGLEGWARDAIKEARRVYEVMPEGTDLAKLTKEQKAEINALADYMVLMGAYRLAYTLNTIFKE